MYQDFTADMISEISAYNKHFDPETTTAQKTISISLLVVEMMQKTNNFMFDFDTL